MPGEQLLAEAAAGWTGPEAAVLSIIGLLAVLACIAIWRHMGECREATERLHQRITDAAAEGREKSEKIEGKLDSIIPLVHRIDERTKEKTP